MAPVDKSRKQKAIRKGESAQPRRSGRHPEAERTVVRLTDAALGDLERMARKGNPQVVRWALKKCLLLERNPEAGEELRGALIGYRKLTVGDRGWRVVWRVTHDRAGCVVVDIAEVWAVGARSDSEVYAEMNTRVAALSASPASMSLAEAVARLGKIAQGIEAAPGPSPDEELAPALPAWLVHVLTNVVKMPHEQGDRLSDQQAQEIWDAYTSTPG